MSNFKKLLEELQPHLDEARLAYLAAVQESENAAAQLEYKHGHYLRLKALAEATSNLIKDEEWKGQSS